jgi:hypothetical protein
MHLIAQEIGHARYALNWVVPVPSKKTFLLGREVCISLPIADYSKGVWMLIADFGN